MLHLWIVFLPLLGALIALRTERFGRTPCVLMTLMAPLLSLLLLLVNAGPVLNGHTLAFQAEWMPLLGLDVAFRLDGLSLLFAVLILGIGLLVMLYSRYYLSGNDSMGRFLALLLLFMTAMLGIVMSDNLVQLWMFWELTSVSSFFLVAFWHDRAEARQGARMALAVTGMGGLALLAGVLLIGEVVGSYNLQTVLQSGDLIRASASYPAILVLVLLGAFTKSAQFPFHFWLPNAMAAPTPASAYLHSATMVKAGIFLLARLHPVLADTQLWFLLVSLTGMATLLYGAYHAFFKHDLKGLLAYSTISHLGLITLLLGMSSNMAAVAALFHVINHAIFKASLFMAAGIIDHESGSRDMRKLNGLWRYMPYTATLAMVAASAMAGVPLLNGFLSKEMFFAETLHQNVLGALSWVFPVLATVGGAFAVAYSTRFIHDVFFNGEPIDLPKVPHEPTRFMKVPIEILVVLCVLVGIFPAWVIADLLSAASATVLNGYKPEFSIAIWHGWNWPLAMSFLAFAGGLFIYYHRRSVFQFQSQFPQQNSLVLFELAMQKVSHVAERIITGMQNGSLQRYIFWLLFFAMVVMAWPLLGLSELMGSKQWMRVSAVELLAAFLLVVCALATVIWHRKRMIALITLSVVGLIVSITFAHFSAPDLALTQLAIEVITIILLMLVLHFLPQKTPKESSPSRIMRDLGLSAMIGGVIGTLCLAFLTRPFDSISQYFLANSKTLGGGTNVVNVILVDFRGFDTLGEISVLGIAALGIYKLFTGMRLTVPLQRLQAQHWSSDAHPLVFTVVSQSLLPLALLVSAYIFLRGHNLPGGGFIAGLVTSVALIQQYVARGDEWMRSRVRVDYITLIACGLLLAIVTGLGSWAFDRPFLTSWFGYFDLPWIGEVELASAILFDLGVYMTVVGATLLILANLGQLAVNEASTVEERV